jgi:pentatricopeptide repeat protein
VTPKSARLVMTICLAVSAVAQISNPRYPIAPKLTEVPGSAGTDQTPDVLDGPCEENLHWSRLDEISAAEKAGEWDRVVVLQKEGVRAACFSEYTWYGLVNALLKANRRPEASRVLDEMDARGFEINPTFIDPAFSEVSKFLGSKEFEASRLGLKIKQLEKVSDERRIKFQAVLKAMPPTERPPENYIAKGVCPFECCRYGNWTVLEDTDLVASPGSKRVVGKAIKGSHVVGVTGEVHLRPEPVIVLIDGDLPKNTIAFILDHGGEGFGDVYTRGKVITTFLGYSEYCFRPFEYCWGETLLPSKETKEQVWWVKVRLSNGVVGWTDKAERFGNKDRCGS